MSQISDYFAKKIHAANNHQRRVDKLSDIEKDKAIDRAIKKRMDQSDDPRIKTSLYYKLYRTYEVQAELLPSTTPVSETWGPAELVAVSSVKDIIYSDGDYNLLFQRIINKNFRTDGPAFVEVGFSPDGSCIKPKTHQFANTFFDYDADYFAVDERDIGEEFSKWVAFRVRLTPEKARKLYPGFNFVEGDIVNNNIFGTENKNAGGQASSNDKKVTIYHCFSIEDEPKFCIMAGFNGDSILEGEGKETYMRFIKRANDKEYAFLPVVDFHFTTVGEGLCTMSMVGVMSDIANSDQRINDIAIPGLKKVVNKIIAVFGTQGQDMTGLSERVREELMLAGERQTLGLNPVVAMPGGTQVTTIAPDARIIQEFISIRATMMEMANARFDIDFVRLANDDVKATVFVGKTKAELQAISGVYKINRGGFDRMADYSIALSKYWRLDDERSVRVPVNKETGYSVGVSLRDLLLAMPEWNGSFTTDVDLRMPLSTADKSAAIVDLENQKKNIFYGKQFSSIEEIIDEIDVLVQRAGMAGLEELYKKPDLVKKAKAILNARNNSQMLAAKMTGGNDTLDTANQDVAKELAPQTALKESGMSVR